MVTLDWGILLIGLPLTSALLTFLFRAASHWIGISTALAINGAIAVLITQMLESPEVHRYPIGGWGAPLGIELYLDGLSATMLIMSALVGLAVSLYAPAYFRTKSTIDNLQAVANKPGYDLWGMLQGKPTAGMTQHTDPEEYFWPLWLFLWAGLNALFLSADIFNLYVTLELVSLSAVALTALAGSKEALISAMRYLLVSLLGSLCYLLGVALLYHTFATVDIALLAERFIALPASWASLGLMTAGLLLKSALFPLHFWLPAAHGSAIAPVSALLSALVVKASFYLLLRLWLELFGTIGVAATDLLGLMGAAAILWGSLQALRQTRLKLLIAYSTVAQLGYLFIAFPLAAGHASAWQGALYLALSHALAKGAMFLAAGNILLFSGHDRISALDRVAQQLPLSLMAFALAGVSIMGLPPSGGFIGKWLLLEAAISQGSWGWALAILTGGLLAAGYIFKVISHAFNQVETPHKTQRVPAIMQWSALLLAIGSLLLGLIVAQPLNLLEIGDPFKTARFSSQP